jgi:hypothetical protein
LATFWKRIANVHSTAFPTVVTGATRTTCEVAERAFRKPAAALFDNMTPISEEPSRIAYCECGAQLTGQSEQELFDAAQQHLAHHHPQLLGALGLDVVQQMAEERPGAMNA